MGLKVGDKVRIKTFEEMLKNCFVDFYGHEFFKKWGSHKFMIIDIADGILDKTFKINVNDEWENYYISPDAFEKINNLDIKLDENLFEL